MNFSRRKLVSEHFKDMCTLEVNEGLEEVKNCCPACEYRFENLFSCINGYCESFTSIPTNVPTDSLLPTSSKGPSESPSFMPSFMPTTAPTDSLSLSPTSSKALSESPSFIPTTAPSNCLPLTINVQTDTYGCDTSFDLRNSETNAVLWEETDFNSNTFYQFSPCIEKLNTTCIYFTFYDSYADGLLKFYEVWYDEILVTEGGNERGSRYFSNETSRKFGNCPPSETPSEIPSRTPTLLPTENPTTTEIPSKIPSMPPTIAPPTIAPTDTPTTTLPGFFFTWDRQSWNKNTFQWKVVALSDEITQLPNEKSEIFLNFWWTDRGWDDLKCRFRITLWNEETKATYLLDAVANRAWTHIDEKLGYDNPIIYNAAIRDKYVIEFFVGDGSNRLYVDDFKLRIPFVGASLSPTNTPTNVPTTPTFSPPTGNKDDGNSLGHSASAVLGIAIAGITGLTLLFGV